MIDQPTICAIAASLGVGVIATTSLSGEIFKTVAEPVFPSSQRLSLLNRYR